MCSNLYIYNQGSVLDYANKTLILIYDPKSKRKKKFLVRI